MNPYNYPDGKLTEHDEGDLQIALTNHDGCVIVQFGKSVKWFGVPPQTARELARLLIQHAEEVEASGH